MAESTTESGTTSGTTDPTSADTTGSSSSEADTDDSCADDWWDPTWKSRAWVTVDTDAIDVPIETMAIPLQLSEIAEIARADGFDFRFIDDEGFILDFELDEWEAASGGVAWVRQENLVPGEERGFWVYFAHPNASSGHSPDELWQGLGSVWHLGRLVEGALPEAGMTGAAGQNEGTFDTAGALALARRFPDTADAHIDFGSEADALFDGWSQMSMSMWISVDYPSDEDWVMGQVITRGAAIAGAYTLREAEQRPGLGYLRLDAAFEGNETVTSEIEIPRETWVWVAWDFDSDVLRTYLDGQLVGEQDVSGSALAAGQLPLMLGAANESFVGNLDELRIEEASHGAPYYAAQHRAMTFALTELGPVENCE